MCGIAGWVTSSDIRPDEATLHRMCDAIIHRGPDSEGIYIDQHVALGARRLSIIDLATGDQPIRSSDGEISLVFNGEIYNFREVRGELEALGHRFQTQGDSEVVVQAYLAWGDAFLDRLNGMFALALWDRPRQRLVLARDRLGKKPLLIAQTGSTLVFGSEFRAVLSHPSVSRDVDPLSIDTFLTLGYIPAPRSAFRDIRKLRPGHMLIWERGQVQERAYWTLTHAPVAMSEGEALERFNTLLRDSVRLRLIADVPLGAFLSGGVDSATVVATMAELAEGRVKTFSIGFADQAYNELPIARLLAERYATEHHEFIVEPRATELLPRIVQHYGEPYADSSALPTFELARVTRTHVTVALNGDGGDELFGGYDRYRALMLAESARSRLPIPGTVYRAAAEMLPASAGQRSLAGRARRFMDGLSAEPGAQYAAWMSIMPYADRQACYTSELRDMIGAQRSDELLSAAFLDSDLRSPAETAMVLDTALYLPDDLLVKVDIATMASSLEARSPLLDYRLAELAASLPLDLKIRNGTSKYLMKRAMRGRIPNEILYRPKSGFGVPLARWFREDLAATLREVVLSDRALARGYFEPGVLRRMVDAHVDGQADFAPRLWALLVLELWHQTFVDSSTGITTMAADAAIELGARRA